MPTNQTKQNVDRFNQDTLANNGYLYSTNAPYSAIKSNDRISRAVIAKIPAQTGRIIDLGCGDGVYTAKFAEAFPLAYIEANDPAHKAIEMAQQRFPHINFRVANILDLSTQTTTPFDVAVIRGVIHHLPDNSQQLAIQNARAIAKTLIIVEPNGNNPILKLIEKNSAYHIAHEEQSFTSETLMSWCVAAGWKDVSVNYIGFVPFFFPEVLARIIYFFQPLLERIPIINKYFSAQIVVVCRA
jgi:2-polyprenyl-3-methyl-5-hydroxy-6-metoxy-1,4-benzoquinol methylase